VFDLSHLWFYVEVYGENTFRYDFKKLYFQIFIQSYMNFLFMKMTHLPRKFLENCILYIFTKDSNSLKCKRVMQLLHFCCHCTINIFCNLFNFPFVTNWMPCCLYSYRVSNTKSFCLTFLPVIFIKIVMLTFRRKRLSTLSNKPCDIGNIETNENKSRRSCIPNS
jgi:hypothetical protein